VTEDRALTCLQQQAEQQPQVEQQYAAQSDTGNDASGYDFDAAVSRPSSRGSKHSVESNGSLGSSAGGYNQQHYHKNPQVQQQQGSHQGGSRLDEDDDDMW
jgi:hypothetical protein